MKDGLEVCDWKCFSSHHSQVYVCVHVLRDLKNEAAMNSAVQEMNSAKILKELRCDFFDS